LHCVILFFEIVFVLLTSLLLDPFLNQVDTAASPLPQLGQLSK